MRRTKFPVGPLFAAALLLAGSGAKAHCDSVDGPVAQAVGKALESGNIYLVLPYAPASAEAELKEAFVAARKVRGLGADARALADRSFLETRSACTVPVKVPNTRASSRRVSITAR